MWLEGGVVCWGRSSSVLPVGGREGGAVSGVVHMQGSVRVCVCVCIYDAHTHVHVHTCTYMYTPYMRVNVNYNTYTHMCIYQFECVH